VRVRMIRTLICSAAALAVCVSFCGAQSATTTPTVITAKTLTFDYRRSIAVLEGDVTAVDPQMMLTADKANVLFDSTNSVKSLVAMGNVHLWYGDKTATCRHAVYVAKTGEVVMRGDATLQRDKDTLTGDEITFYLNDDRVVCKPGHLVIFSEEGRKSGSDFPLKK